MRLAGDRHPATLRRHLLMREEVIVATRAHWASLIEPVVTTVAVFLAVSWITAAASAQAYDAAQVLWWLWLAVLGRLIWKAAEWGNEWFAVTDKRLLKTYGLFTKNVAMMPLRKVTDLNYQRSVWGRMLGYGRFTLESAGQDQAMHDIDWLPAPDEIYQRIGDAVFGRSGADPDEDGPDPTPQRREPARGEPPPNHDDQRDEHDEHDEYEEHDDWPDEQLEEPAERVEAPSPRRSDDVAVERSTEDASSWTPVRPRVAAGGVRHSAAAADRSEDPDRTGPLPPPPTA